MTNKFYIIMLIIIALIMLFLAQGCTKQSRVFVWGGSDTIILQPNEKLINVTWKESNVWFFTRPMSTTDSCETYTFYESSSVGLLEGKLIIKEVKK